MKSATRAGEKEVPRRVTVSSGTVEAFIGRSMERAHKMDRGEKLPLEITMTLEDPSDAMRLVSAEQVRVLRAIRAKPAPVSQLATTLRRASCREVPARGEDLR